MKKRIGLFTSKTARRKAGDATTTASYVEIEEIPDLKERLAGLGAKRVGLLQRDRLGATHLEGEMFSPAELKSEHVEWLTSPGEEFQTRGLFYDSH
jgi:hypothetical protein